MQVCDTHVFSRLKAYIRQGMERLRLDSVTGEASTQSAMQLLAEAASSSSGAAIEVAAAQEAGKGDELTEKIFALQKQQKDLLDQKKHLQKDLRKAKRRKTRLTKRTRLLSDSDHIQIMLMRDAKKKEATQTKQREDEKVGKAPVAAAANPDGDAAEPKPSQPEDGPCEDGDMEEE